MYKTTLSALALAASLSMAVAQDTPETTPAPAAAPAAEQPTAVSMQDLAGPSAEEQAKIMKEMMEFEEACKAAGLGDTASQAPDQAEMIVFLSVIDNFLARTDLSEETLAQLFQLKIMVSILSAESAADMVKLKTDLETVAANYPSLAADINDGLAQMFANGPEGLYNDSQSMRDQYAMMMAAQAAQATPADEATTMPETSEEKPAADPAPEAPAPAPAPEAPAPTPEA